MIQSFMAVQRNSESRGEMARKREGGGGRFDELGGRSIEKH